MLRHGRHHEPTSGHETGTSWIRVDPDFGGLSLMARSRRLNPPSQLNGMSDDVILTVFARVLLVSHVVLRAACRRLEILAPRVRSSSAQPFQESDPQISRRASRRLAAR